MLLHFIGVLPELWAELDAMTLPIGSKQVSVYDLVKGAVVVVVTISATLWLSGLVEQRLQGAATARQQRPRRREQARCARRCSSSAC